MVEKNKKIT